MTEPGANFKFVTAPEWADELDAKQVIGVCDIMRIQANAIRFAAIYCKRIAEYNEFVGAERAALLKAEEFLTLAAMQVLEGKGPVAQPPISVEL